MDDEGHVCLTDFGMAKELKEGELTKSFVGTPEYLGRLRFLSKLKIVCSSWSYWWKRSWKACRLVGFRNSYVKPLGKYLSNPCVVLRWSSECHLFIAETIIINKCLFQSRKKKSILEPELKWLLKLKILSSV